jgi:ABC-type multidrug transport system fused ATPase/permease subunit
MRNQAIVQVRSLMQVTRLNSRNIFIILTVMILIALTIILATAAFAQNDELSVDYDEDEFSIFLNWGTILPAVSFLVTLFIPIRWMGVHAGVLCAADLGGGILAPP